MSNRPEISWVVLTMGTRPVEFRSAVASLQDPGVEVVTVNNGGDWADVQDSIGPSANVRRIDSAENLGIPGGRDLGIKETETSIVGFLDDDAEFRGDSQRLLDAFRDDDRLGAVALRLVDEQGSTSRRHVPRVGSAGVSEGGEVAYFLGGACAIRREAYEQVGGYFTELFYGHEEIELSWRLIDAGWRIHYLADVEVFHPRTDVSRHPDGWRLTGRNRVWIARRSLPWPVALIHISVWLALGAVRAPAGACRRSYVQGWRAGWSDRIERRPISWRGVWRLTRLGRPPLI